MSNDFRSAIRLIPSRKTGVRSGQAMVEFALIIPILLLMIMAIFAFAHLMFMYITINSAAREGARIGSGAGQSLINASLNHYQDCVEIRNAVKRVGRFAGIDDGEITIEFVNGAGSVLGHCNGTTSTVGTMTSANRISVSLAVNYNPFFPVINLPSFIINASSVRTIITNISIT